MRSSTSKGSPTKSETLRQPMGTITTGDLWAQNEIQKATLKDSWKKIKGQSINRAFAFIYSTFNEALKWVGLIQLLIIGN